METSLIIYRLYGDLGASDDLGGADPRALEGESEDFIGFGLKPPSAMDNVMISEEDGGGESVLSEESEQLLVITDEDDDVQQVVKGGN